MNLVKSNYSKSDISLLQLLQPIGNEPRLHAILMVLLNHSKKRKTRVRLTYQGPDRLTNSMSLVLLNLCLIRSNICGCSSRARSIGAITMACHSHTTEAHQTLDKGNQILEQGSVHKQCNPSIMHKTISCHFLICTEFNLLPHITCKGYSNVEASPCNRKNNYRMFQVTSYMDHLSDLCDPLLSWSEVSIDYLHHPLVRAKDDTITSSTPTKSSPQLIASLNVSPRLLSGVANFFQEHQRYNMLGTGANVHWYNCRTSLIPEESQQTLGRVHLPPASRCFNIQVKKSINPGIHKDNI